MFSTAKITSVSSAMVRQAILEAAGVVLLPAERRVHHDHLGAEPLGKFLRPGAASPTARGPRPAG